MYRSPGGLFSRSVIFEFGSFLEMFLLKSAFFFEFKLCSKLEEVRKVKLKQKINMIGEGNVISYNNPMIHPNRVSRDEEWAKRNQEWSKNNPLSAKS
jgi:hypothetical protein